MLDETDYNITAHGFDPISQEYGADSMPTEQFAGQEVQPSAQQAILIVEGGQEVFYRGSYVNRIPLKSGSLLIGRRDVMAGHYPDIDLIMYRKLDPSISRKHAQVYRDIDGKYFIEDLCNNNATFINDYSGKLNHERRELKNGDRIFIATAISFLFRVG